ncbi:Hypothetical protein NocV09_05500220 [Nannochloropsis oceanica]
MAEPGSKKTLSLAHLKQPTLVVPPEPPPRRIAWAGGKITTNKEEATLQFLRRKQAQGTHTFTPEQLALLKRMTRTGGGETERGVMQTSDGVQSFRQDEGRKVEGMTQEQVLLRQAVAWQEKTQGIANRGGRVKKRGRFLVNGNEEKEEEIEWVGNREAGNKRRSREDWVRGGGRGGGGGGGGGEEGGGGGGYVWERGRGALGGGVGVERWKKQEQGRVGRPGGQRQGRGRGRGRGGQNSLCDERGKKAFPITMALESKLGMSLDELVKKGEGK